MERNLVARSVRLFLLLTVAVVVLAALAGRSTGTSGAHDASAITGRWLVEKRDAIIHVEPQGAHFVGRVVWAKERDGIKAEDRLDTKNPDPDLRSRKVLGLDVLTGIPTTPDEEGWYGKGRIYNPKTGKSYPVKLRLEAPDRLRLRVGGSVIGQTTRWTRAE